MILGKLYSCPDMHNVSSDTDYFNKLTTIKSREPFVLLDICKEEGYCKVLTLAGVVGRIWMPEPKYWLDEVT